MTTLKQPVTLSDMQRMSNDEKLERTDFFVEATCFERHELWYRWTHRNKDKDTLVWKQDLSGFSSTIGHIKKDRSMSVVVSFSFALIGNCYVCFYEATSRFVDHTMIEEWIRKNHPVKYDKGLRTAMTNAHNFHTCYRFCQGKYKNESEL